LDIFEIKKTNSIKKIEEFRASINGCPELAAMNGLSIYVTGSYGRHEASIHSDIDLFFMVDGNLQEAESPNIKSLRMFSKIIEVADGMKFPAFSNDGEYLKILESSHLSIHLGGREDDYKNYFTARMLMLLESQPIYDQETYSTIIAGIIDSYFRDYKHHPKNFRPVFIINDILRFWKTLCLNYENKRNSSDDDDIKKVRQKCLTSAPMGPNSAIY